MKRFFFPLKPPITQGSWWSRLIRLYFFNPFFKFLLHSSSFGVFPIVSSGLSDDTVAMQMRRWTSEKRKMRIFSSALSSPCGVKNPSFGRPPSNLPVCSLDRALVVTLHPKEKKKEMLITFFFKFIYSLLICNFHIISISYVK